MPNDKISQNVVIRTIPVELLELFDSIAKLHGRSRNEEFKQVLKYYVEMHKPYLDKTYETRSGLPKEWIDSTELLREMRNA